MVSYDGLRRYAGELFGRPITEVKVPKETGQGSLQVKIQVCFDGRVLAESEISDIVPGSTVIILQRVGSSTNG